MRSHKPTLLIDGDIIAYKASAAVQRDFNWGGVGEDGGVSVGHFEEARVIVEDALASLLKAFKTKHYIVAMTDEVNWRTAVYPLYKMNRSGKPRPVCLSAIKTHITENHPTYQRHTLEADDILGILATSTRIITHPGERIIVSADKDMKGIPGLFYDLGPREVFEISEQEANRFHMFQTLTGDTADGYPGCRGIGPVKAERILEQGESYPEWWPLIVAAYENKNRTEQDALVQARIARILRATDYDFKKQEVKLWKP